MLRTLALVIALVFVGSTKADEPLLVDGENRIVFVGNTLVERAHRFGYWETMLVASNPDKKLTVRNLGWSGDNIFGLARASFGSPKEGHNRLKNQVATAKPTLLVLGYGSVEAFDGKSALPRFLTGVNELVDHVKATKPRTVIVGPLRQENLGPPLPNPAAQNVRLAIYNEALRELSKKRAATFVDLFGTFTKAEPLTYNGIHMTADGYWRTGVVLAGRLGCRPSEWSVSANADGDIDKATGCKVVERDGLAWQVTDEALPIPPRPGNEGGSLPKGQQRTFRVLGLADGNYRLLVDDKVVSTASAEQWAKGVALTSGPQFDHVEKLRAAIVEKNRLFFHRWRPQNETYIFGFRKHEQGKYAKEIPQFDPLIAKMEREIDTLKKPRAHRFELRKVE